MWYAWGQVHIEFQLKERERMEDLDVNGRTMDFKEVGWEGMN
jgi:hypothetical protein